MIAKATLAVPWFVWLPLLLALAVILWHELGVPRLNRVRRERRAWRSINRPSKGWG